MRKSELLARIEALESLVAKQADQIKAMSTPGFWPGQWMTPPPLGIFQTGISPAFTPPKWVPSRTGDPLPSTPIITCTN